ncbi:hypothetical protein PGT21_000018 [Puccinia graminis f. sp. tritici]|uniref:Uncharacterized protein n=1 Tax=Puccinia graminis f. sp. tritici TaxID=56615 RepID=A0A5B0MRG7_PUCGR|nr:hypothetical protein PGT21_000018 [Puccinia graminis f. sp. tritici]
MSSQPTQSSMSNQSGNVSNATEVQTRQSSRVTTPMKRSGMIQPSPDFHCGKLIHDSLLSHSPFSDRFPSSPSPPFSFYYELHSCQLSHTPVLLCFPRSPLMSLPCTPFVTPPTPASQCTPPAALGKVSTAASASGPLEPRFRLSVLPLPCSLSAAYTKPSPQSAREPQSPPVPRIPRSKLFGTLRIRPCFSRPPAPWKARLSTKAR